MTSPAPWATRSSGSSPICWAATAGPTPVGSRTAAPTSSRCSRYSTAAGTTGSAARDRPDPEVAAAGHSRGCWRAWATSTRVCTGRSRSGAGRAAGPPHSSCLVARHGVLLPLPPPGVRAGDSLRRGDTRPSQPSTASALGHVGPRPGTVWSASPAGTSTTGHPDRAGAAELRLIGLEFGRIIHLCSLADGSARLRPWSGGPRRARRGPRARRSTGNGSGSPRSTASGARLCERPAPPPKPRLCYLEAIEVARKQEARYLRAPVRHRASRGCGRVRADGTRPASCSPRSTAGSPRASTRPPLEEARSLLDDLGAADQNE